MVQSFLVVVVSSSSPPMERERFLRMNDDGGRECLRTVKLRSSSPTRSVPTSYPPSGTVGVNGGLNYIIHTVSKYDTLAGVAIKYGVEVADIKRLNGLVADLQMFALKTIQIPLPGRHPPSPVLSSCHDAPRQPTSSQHTTSSRRHSNFLDSFPSLKLKSSSENKVSPAMSGLQDYYGLRPKDQKGRAEGFAMAVYRNGQSHYLEDGPSARSSTISNPPLSHHRKSKSAVNCLASENGELSDQDSLPEAKINDCAKWNEKLVRRRQKSDDDFISHAPEKLLKEENANSLSISAITGKGLALRPKSANRTVLGGADGDTGGGFSPIPIGLGDNFLMDDSDGVQKSSSASSLPDTDNSALLSLWPTSKCSLKPDFQALSAAAIVIPIFDGLGKPSNRRNKAALD